MSWSRSYGGQPPPSTAQFAEARRDRQHQQARPGPRTGLLCRADRGASRRPPGGSRRANDWCAPLGLWGGDLDFQLPDALPPLPRAAAALAAIEAEAVRTRLDLQIARIEVDVAGEILDLTNATRFINLLELAGDPQDRARPGSAPLPSGGRLRTPGSDLRLRRGADTPGRGDLQAGRQPPGREGGQHPLGGPRSLSGLPAAYDIARHYARDPAAAQDHHRRDAAALQRMQVDVFALLAEARQRIATNSAAIEAKRDFCLAERRTRRRDRRRRRCDAA